MKFDSHADSQAEGRQIFERLKNGPGKRGGPVSHGSADSATALHGRRLVSPGAVETPGAELGLRHAVGASDPDGHVIQLISSRR